MESNKEREKNFEAHIEKIDEKIERLKVQYNLFFSGEINIPPEKERVDMEKIVRNILSSNLKSARVNLLAQNVSSKFNIYNNMWKKKLNQLESGELSRPTKSDRKFIMREKSSDNISKEVEVSLNNENSFDNLFNQIQSINSKGSKSSKEEIVNKIKVKLISENIIDAKVQIVKSENGKIKVKIKK